MSQQAKNILLTGATSDLAKSFARRACARIGYRLLMISRGTQEPISCSGDTVCRQLTGLDLALESNQQAIQGATNEFFDNAFSVVHFAGSPWRNKPLTATRFSEIVEMINSHYITLCNVIQAVTPVLRSRKGGRVVAFSCNSVGYNYPDMSPFSAAKAAVETLMKCYAHEQAEYGISSTVLALPTVRTDGVIAANPNGDHEDYVTPGELADMILDDVLMQNRYVTGNVRGLFRYSRSFYHTGYFLRNPRTLQ